MYWRVPLTSRSSEALITSGWHPSPQVGGWEDALTLTASNRGELAVGSSAMDKAVLCGLLWSLHKAVLRSCNHFSKELLMIPVL